MFYKLRKKYMPKGPFNNFNVKTKNDVKLNNFKQITM